MNAPPDTSLNTPPPLNRKKKPKLGLSCLLVGLAFIFLTVLALVGIWFWSNRPLKPVTLSKTELSEVQKKLDAIQGNKEPPQELPPLGEASETAAPPDGKTGQDELAEKGDPESEYKPGDKVIELTERELNGLLNKNTGLGENLQLKLLDDEINARAEIDLDPDLPLVGGRRLKARARFLLSEDEKGTHFYIDDVTVWGISLPNDWLGGLKNRDLISEVLGSSSGNLPGVKSMKVEKGKVRIELKE